MNTEYNVEKYELDTKLEEIRNNYLRFNITEYGCKHCRCYDNNWTCPPFKENQLDIWSKYENVKLIMLKYNFSKEFLNKQKSYEEFIEYSFDLIHSQKKIIEHDLYNLEKELNGEFLTSGPCVNCNVCQRSLGKSCVKPNERKYAMESLGANVIDIAKRYFDLDLEWIRGNSKPNFLIMMVCVLY